MKRTLFTTALLLICMPLLATTVVLVSNEESIKLSDLILIGRVAHVETTYDREGQIVRNVTLAVKETLKGKVQPGSNFVFQAWGGVKDGTRNVAVGEAKYKVGERILVLLENLDGTYHTLGLSFGKWNIQKDKSGKEVLQRDLSELTGVRKGAQPVVSYMELKQMRELVQKVERDRIGR